MKRLLALFAALACAAALPAQAQLDPITPAVPDSIYLTAEMRAGEAHLSNGLRWNEQTGAPCPAPFEDNPFWTPEQVREIRAATSNHVCPAVYKLFPDSTVLRGRGKNYVTTPSGFYDYTLEMGEWTTGNRLNRNRTGHLQSHGSKYGAYGFRFYYLYHIGTYDSNELGPLVLKFSGGVNDNPESINAYNQFIKNAMLIIGNDSLSFSEARTDTIYWTAVRWIPPGTRGYTNGGWSGGGVKPDSVDAECNFRILKINDFCWPNSKNYFEKDGFTEVSISLPSAEPYYLPPPSRAPGELRFWTDRVNGVRQAGKVWLSWRIPSGHADPAEQIQQEKELEWAYEYQVLRDGDGTWKRFTVEETQLDAIETVSDLFGDISYQRRKYRVDGLDPAGEYSFCLRVVNASGTSPESCNYGKIKPVSTESAELPAAVTLAQNYPNPFNPSTAIRYELPAAEHVRLDVFDVSGRNVKVLVDGTRPAGTHTARFDAGGLPSGLYVYRLQAGGNTIVKTMHLIR